MEILTSTTADLIGSPSALVSMALVAMLIAYIIIALCKYYWYIKMGLKKAESLYNTTALNALSVVIMILTIHATTYWTPTSNLVTTLEIFFYHGLFIDLMVDLFVLIARSMNLESKAEFILDACVISPKFLLCLILYNNAFLYFSIAVLLLINTVVFLPTKENLEKNNEARRMPKANLLIKS